MNRIYVPPSLSMVAVICSLFQLHGQSFDQHPTKKSLSRYTTDTVYTAEVFFAFEWQTHDKIVEIIEAQAVSGSPINLKDLKHDILGNFRTVSSLLSSLLNSSGVVFDAQHKEWYSKNNVGLSSRDKFLIKAYSEFRRISISVGLKLDRFKEEALSGQELLSTLKFYKNMMSGFWKTMGEWFVWKNDVPIKGLLEGSIIKLDYDHNAVLFPRSRAVEVISKDEFEAFCNKDLPFFQSELALVLRDDFLDPKGHKSQKAVCAFFSLVNKLCMALFVIPASFFVTCRQEVYNTLYDCVFKLLDGFNKRYARLSRFASCDKLAKTNVWRLAYWFYNVFPYKDCSFSSAENDYLIADQFWQTCKNLDKTFKVSARRIPLPFY